MGQDMVVDSSKKNLTLQDILNPDLSFILEKCKQ